MPKYKITAESVGYLEETIEAKNEDEAWDIFEEMLENGEVSEASDPSGWPTGSIENKRVELVEE